MKKFLVFALIILIFAASIFAKQIGSFTLYPDAVVKLSSHPGKDMAILSSEAKELVNRCNYQIDLESCIGLSFLDFKVLTPNLDWKLGACDEKVDEANTITTLKQIYDNCLSSKTTQMDGCVCGLFDPSKINKDYYVSLLPNRESIELRLVYKKDDKEQLLSQYTQLVQGQDLTSFENINGADVIRIPHEVRLNSKTCDDETMCANGKIQFVLTKEFAPAGSNKVSIADQKKVKSLSGCKGESVLDSHSAENIYRFCVTSKQKVMKMGIDKIPYEAPLQYKFALTFNRYSVPLGADKENAQLIIKEALSQNVPADYALAIGLVESGGTLKHINSDGNVVINSKSGAIGLFQIVSQDLCQGLDINNLNDNIKCGISILKQKCQIFSTLSSDKLPCDTSADKLYFACKKTNYTKWDIAAYLYYGQISNCESALDAELNYVTLVNVYRLRILGAFRVPLLGEI